MNSVEMRVSKAGTVRYLARYRDDDGKSRSKSFITAADAEAWLSVLSAHGIRHAVTLLTQDSTAPDNADALTFATVAERWLATLPQEKRSTEQARGTLKALPQSIRRTLAPEITREQIQGYIDGMLATHSDATIRTYVQRISAVMNYAIEHGHATKNPTRGLNYGSRPHTEKQPLERHEVDLLAGMIAPHLRAFVYLCCLTGLRFSEATALLAGDIDLKRRTVRVTKAWKKPAKGADYVGAPKSKKSVRTVAIPTSIIPVLTEHLAGKSPGELAFKDTQGKRLQHAGFNYQWSKVRGELKNKTGKNVTPHAMRHTFASLALSAGIQVHVVSRALGHSSVAITYEVYAHLLNDDIYALADAIA